MNAGSQAHGPLTDGANLAMSDRVVPPKQAIAAGHLSADFTHSNFKRARSHDKVSCLRGNRELGVSLFGLRNESIDGGKELRTAEIRAAKDEFM